MAPSEAVNLSPIFMVGPLSDSEPNRYHCFRPGTNANATKVGASATKPHLRHKVPALATSPPITSGSGGSAVIGRVEREVQIMGEADSGLGDAALDDRHGAVHIGVVDEHAGARLAGHPGDLVRAILAGARDDHAIAEHGPDRDLVGFRGPLPRLRGHPFGAPGIGTT